MLGRCFAIKNSHYEGVQNKQLLMSCFFVLPYFGKKKTYDIRFTILLRKAAGQWENRYGIIAKAATG